MKCACLVLFTVRSSFRILSKVRHRPNQNEYGIVYWLVISNSCFIKVTKPCFICRRPTSLGEFFAFVLCVCTVLINWIWCSYPIPSKLYNHCKKWEWTSTHTHTHTWMKWHEWKKKRGRGICANLARAWRLSWCMRLRVFVSDQND